MKTVIKVLLVLVVLALLAPTWLQDPGAESALSQGEWAAVPARLQLLTTELKAAVTRLDPLARLQPGASAAARDPGEYYRWQGEDGVWHFSDQQPAGQVNPPDPKPLPLVSNSMGAPRSVTTDPEPLPETGVVPEFDSSMTPPLPEGVSREALESLLQEAHERRMGEQQ